MKRFRIRHTVPLKERLVEEAKRTIERAHTLPDGEERESLLRKARQADSGWITSSGLQPPK
jgi:hypothetical protein